MNITLNIQAENPQELQEAISGLASSMGGASTPEPEKPKRNTKPKPEKPAEPDPVEVNQDDSESVTDEQLRAKAIEVAKAGNQPAVKALLDKFGSKSVSAIPEDRRADFMKALEAI